MSLAVTDLHAGYPRRPVLEGLTLEPLPASALTALVGPNAAGKSTLLRALAGLLPASGSVRLGADELLTLTLVERARRVALMPQSLPGGVRLTVLEGVLAALQVSPLLQTPRPERGAPVARALDTIERVGLADQALVPLDELSGGQRQLASLAQALVRDADLLLLDEPVSALDLRHQVRVMRVLREVAADGAVVVAVLHDLDLAARWADHTVVLGPRGVGHVQGAPSAAITPATLARLYGVTARVERCSQGQLRVAVDDELAPSAHPVPRGGPA